MGHSIYQAVRGNTALEWHATALVAAANGVVITNREGEIVWTNPAFTRLTGYCSEEIVGRNMRLFKSGEHESEFYAEMWRTILSGDVWRGELTNRSKDGKLFVQEQTITPVRDEIGEISHFIAIQQDISRLRSAQEALRESEERLKFVLDGSHLGFWDWNIETGEVRRNERWAEMLGYRLAEVESNMIQLTDLIHPEDRDCAWKSIQDHLAGRTSMHQMRYRMRGKDGQYKWIFDCARVVTRDENQRPLRMSGTHRDISQRIQDETRIQALERQKAVEAERTRVARDMHDELGASLTRIKVLSERMEQDASDPDKAISHAQLISMTARELAHSMDEIVWAVDPEKDRLENLGSYLVAYAGEFLGIANLRCRLDIPAVLPDVSLSAQVRHSVFLTIKEALNNVVKHAQATEVRLRLVVWRNRLIIRVKDNGCGFGLDAVPSERNGLKNMRKRLAEAGGTCTIRSRPGMGTNVRIVAVIGDEANLQAVEPGSVRLE